MLTDRLQCLSNPLSLPFCRRKFITPASYHLPHFSTKNSFLLVEFSPRVFLSKAKEYLFGNCRGKRGFYMGVI
jgi:hypothetical protein